MTRPCVLFDLDGTLTDADHLHHDAFNLVLRRFDRSIDADFYKSHVMGHANTVIFETLFPGGAVDAHAELANEKEAAFRQLASVLTPAAGLLDLLDVLARRGIACGVVTNAPRQYAVHELEALGMAQRFDTIVLGEELAFAKPHPLPYLTGLERLGAAADCSVAFEDSLSGLRSAKAAGLLTVGLTTSLPAQRLLDEGADLAIADYTDARLAPLLLARLVPDITVAVF